MFCLLLCIFLFKGVFALEVEIPEDLKDDRTLTREERIRRHQKRVQLILDARKKTKEEEQKLQVEEAREKAKNEQPRKPEPPPPPSEGLGFSPSSDKTLAQTILHFYPFDTTVTVGDNFLTDMVLFNAENRSLDALKVTITFNPNLVKPIFVNDFAIHDKMESPAIYKIDMQKGNIAYECRFNSPQELEGEDIIRIVWQALQPTELTEIGFDLSEKSTFLLSDGKDILGTTYMQNDGIIPTGVSILSNMKSRNDFLIVDKEIISQAGLIPSRETTGNMFLNFEIERKVFKPGDIFDVSILLSNPQGQIFDELFLLIRFDPAVLKVLDWDKKNRISAGINIQDGFARKRYPFDFHIRNEASNFTGSIDYRMGSSKPEVLPSGEVSRIRFQAIAPSEQTTIFFTHSKNTRGPNTSISFMGQELISPAQWQEESYHQLFLQVLNP
jgi:hypothetical protein